MSKRYVVLGMSVVLALALAVPAFGGPSNPIADVSASAKKTATKALKKAKVAHKAARNAQSTANNAQGTANTALSTANTANTAAKTAQTSGTGAKTAADHAQAAADEAKAAAAAAQASADESVKGVYTIFGPNSAADTNDPKSASAFCEGDDEATGGGFALGGVGANSVTVTAETPTFYGDGWFVTGEAITGTPTWSIQAVAQCTEK